MKFFMDERDQVPIRTTAEQERMMGQKVMTFLQY